MKITITNNVAFLGEQHRFLHNTRTATLPCRPNVQMSVPSNLKMSVSPAFWRVVGATSMAVLSMSDGELRRLEVLRDLDRRRLMPAAAEGRPGHHSSRPRWRSVIAPGGPAAGGYSTISRLRPRTSTSTSRPRTGGRA